MPDQYPDDVSQTPSHNHPHPRLTLRAPTMPTHFNSARSAAANQQQHQRLPSQEHPPSDSPSHNASASGHSSPPIQQQQQYAARPSPTQNNSNSTQSTPPNQQRPYPQYPLPIAEDKLPRAVDLYGKLQLAKGLAQRDRLHPGRAGPPSVVSHTSSGGLSPVSPSTRGAGRTESVLSFDAESPASAMANASNEFTAYDGKKVKTRKRDKLGPEAKAKAALIRHLGSCWVCRSRRVPCPMDHQDEAALERGWRERELRTQNTRQPINRPYRASTSPQPSHAPLVRDLDVLGRSASQRNPQTRTANPDLAGLGQDFNPATSSHTPTYAAADTMLDPLASIDAQSQYITYQDGQLFLIGIIRQQSLWECQHLVVGGQCRLRFNTIEELQIHFENSHFAFTRIDPCHRFHCFGCEKMCAPEHPCPSCGLPGIKEIRIYGSFIRIPSFDRYQPDGTDFFGFNDFDPTFSAGGLSPDAGFGLGNNNGFDATFGGFGQDFYQNSNNTYAPGPGSQGSNYDAGNTPHQGSFPYQGHQFAKAVDASPTPTRSWFARSLQTKLISIAIALLLTAIFTVKTHDFFIAKARAVYSHQDLPIIGFVGAIASFLLSHTFFCSIKHPPSAGFHRFSRCKMNDLAVSKSFITFGPAAPRAASYFGSGIAL